MVLIQNHVKGPFDPKYIGDYRVVSLKGNQVEIQPTVGGPTEMKHVKHVLPVNRYVDQLPDYFKFGRKTTLRINPNQILDLHRKLANKYHTTNIGQLEIGCTTISVHDISVKTFNEKCVKWCKTSLSTKTCTTQSRQEPAVCSFIPIT